MYTLSWILGRWLKLNIRLVYEENISSNQVIINYSNKVNNKHVQFDDPASIED